MKLTYLPAQPSMLPVEFPEITGSLTASALSEASHHWRRSTSTFNLARDTLFDQLKQLFDAVASTDLSLARSLDAP